MVQTASLFNQLLRHFPRTEFAAEIARLSVESSDPRLTHFTTPSSAWQQLSSDKLALPVP